MIQHIVRRGLRGSPGATEKWLDDMANEHGWELAAVIPSTEPMFVFRREVPSE